MERFADRITKSEKFYRVNINIMNRVLLSFRWIFCTFHTEFRICFARFISRLTFCWHNYLTQTKIKQTIFAFSVHKSQFSISKRAITCNRMRNTFSVGLVPSLSKIFVLSFFIIKYKELKKLYTQNEFFRFGSLN